MQSIKEMQRRIKSIRNLTQMTQAIETVSAAKVRNAVQTLQATRPYAEKAWKVLLHLARQPGHTALHPLLNERPVIDKALVILVSGDRGLAGAFNTEIVRFALNYLRKQSYEVRFVSLGQKGRNCLIRNQQQVIADFCGLPEPPGYSDVLPISRMVINEYISGKADRVYLAYTRYINKLKQEPVIRKLIPLETAHSDDLAEAYNITHPSNAVFIFEPDGREILNQVIMRFTAIQIQEALLESLASEHSARMLTMHNASENGKDLAREHEMFYHRARQNGITNRILDIVNGANALENN